MKEPVTAYTQDTGYQDSTRKVKIHQRIASNLKALVTPSPKEIPEVHVPRGLILTRRAGETVRIGEHGEIKIHVMAMERGHVRLQIDAPRDIAVHREEIFQRIQDEKKIDTT